MRPGRSHHWSYRGHWYERKVAPGKWKIDFKATKRQAGHRGVGAGSRYVWDIRGRQYARKTRSGVYETRLIGTKRLVKANPRR